ncbi:MAG: type II toxin-antitoxin system VapC family toxin [bacterium]|nr:type II toxin-antitoxin system VapC family toxin [bacterium]
MIITENVITELLYVLTSVYSVTTETVKEILESLIQTPGIIIDNDFNLQAVLDIWPNHIKDYGDALLAAFADSRGIKIITFDKSFKKQLGKLDIGVEDI